MSIATLGHSRRAAGRMTRNAGRSLSRVRLLIPALTALSVVAAAGCGSGSSTPATSTDSASGTAHKGGTLTVLSSQALNAIDPASTYQTWDLEILTHDGLVGFKRVDGQTAGNAIVPDLAASIPEPTDGGRTWTFTLRRGIRYSDGKPLQASDFVRTFTRQFTVPGPAPFYTGIVGAAACGKDPKHCDLSHGVVADDAAGTVTFHLVKPDAQWLQKLAVPFAFAVPGDTTLKALPAGPPPGTGPYMWESYDPGKGGVLVRNPHFKQWSKDAQPAGNPDRIVVKTGLNLESEVTEIQNGQADAMYWTDPIPTDRLGELSTSSASQLHIHLVAQTNYFALNTRVAPFDNLKARQAINYAVDRAAYVKIAGGSQLAVPTCQVLPPGFPGYEAYCPYTTDAGDGTWHAPDLAKARQLVRESGTSGAKVTVVGETSEVSKATALQMVSDLQKIGYQASTKLLAPGLSPAYISNSSNKVQMGYTLWLQDFPAASDFLNVALSCNTYTANSDSNPNQAEFCSPAVQAKMDHAEAVGVTDPVAANKLWADVDRDVTDQGPWLSLYTPKQINFVSSRVRGFAWHPVFTILFDQLWLG